MLHYDLTPSQRQQLNHGRHYSVVAPLCNTGDGHYVGVAPEQWKGAAPIISCPACCERKGLLSKRDREKANWAS